MRLLFIFSRGHRVNLVMKPPPPKRQDESTTALTRGIKSMGKPDPKPDKKMKKVAKAMLKDAKNGNPKSKV